MCLYIYIRNRTGYDSKLLDTMSSSDSDTYSKVTTTAIPPELSFGMVLTNRTLSVWLRFPVHQQLR